MKTMLYLVPQASPESGATSVDAPLGRRARREAELTRDFLAVRAIDHTYSSPRRHALQTARILAAPHQLTPRPLPALDEGEGVTADNFAQAQQRVTASL